MQILSELLGPILQIVLGILFFLRARAFAIYLASRPQSKWLWKARSEKFYFWYVRILALALTIWGLVNLARNVRLLVSSN